MQLVVLKLLASSTDNPNSWIASVSSSPSRRLLAADALTSTSSWCNCSSAALAYYAVDLSRGRKVLRSVLTDEFKGILISDFYGVYFNLPYRKQKCLVHLLREFRECAKRDNSVEYHRSYKKIKRLINDALRLQGQHGRMNKTAYLRRVAMIKQRLFDFMTYPYRNKNLKRLSKRFSKFWLDMFTFLQDPGIAWNNNLAERMIRPNVIYRNRSFGNRSPRGAQAHATMMSLIQTLRLQKQDAAEFLKTAFIAHRQGAGINPL